MFLEKQLLSSLETFLSAFLGSPDHHKRHDNVAMRGEFGRLTPEEYEARYAEALAVVRGKTPNVGEPETMPDGTRFVRVGAMRCADEIVFTLAWGKETAVDIMAQRRAGRR